MCALKVSLSTAKGKHMPARERLPTATRSVRIFKLAAAISLVTALVALVAVARGDLAGRSHTLIVVAVLLGGFALIGMALAILPYALRQKDKNDPRP
jgi:hypothetical protein